jgi:hypothetical protein
LTWYLIPIAVLIMVCASATAASRSGFVARAAMAFVIMFAKRCGSTSTISPRSSGLSSITAATSFVIGPM